MTKSGNRGDLPPPISPRRQRQRSPQDQQEHPEANQDGHRAEVARGPGEVFRASEEDLERVPQTAGGRLPNCLEAGEGDHPDSGHLSPQRYLREDGVAYPVVFRKGTHH